MLEWLELDNAAQFSPSQVDVDAVNASLGYLASMHLHRASS